MSREQLQDFIDDNLRDELEILSLKNEERKILHELCEGMGLFSYSVGVGNDRHIIVRKQRKPVEVSDEDRKLFIRDFVLPIPVYDLRYFEYFIELYDNFYHTKSKYNLLIDAIEKLNKKHQQFKHHSHNLLDRVVKGISGTPAYKKFVDEYNVENMGELPNETHIYSKGDGMFPRYYLSCDIIKANFNSLRYINPEIVLGCETWEELMRKFTDIEYFIQSKHFRQVVFGSLKSMKKSASVQKYLLSKLYQSIKNDVHVQGKVASDEIIVATTKENIKEDYNKLVKIIDDAKMSSVWRVVPISIQPIGKSDAYIKKTIININKPFDDISNLKFDIKNINKDFHAQAYKFYMNMELCGYDMKAMKDGYLITYDQPYLFD